MNEVALRRGVRLPLAPTSMKSRAMGGVLAALCLLFGVLGNATAQDMIVTDLAWFDPAKPDADTLPKIPKPLTVVSPAELKGVDEITYCLVYLNVLATGDRGDLTARVSHDALKKIEAIKNFFPKDRLVPAQVGSKNTEASCWMAIIFNPASSSVDGTDVGARLTKISPIVVADDTGKKLDEAKLKRVRVRVRISSDGRVLSPINFSESSHEFLRSDIEPVISNWAFSPARKNNEAVESEVELNVIVRGRWMPNQPTFDTPAKGKKSNVGPKYPYAMKFFNQQGKVMVVYTIDKNGDVKNPSVYKSNHPGFEENALNAVLTWKYEPALKNGQPVEVRVSQWINFDLGLESDSGAASVDKVSKKQLSNLPEEYRYDEAPVADGVLYPIYPFSLLMDRKAGTAEAAFMVDEKGNVVAIEIMNATKPEFGEALTAALSAYHFQPAKKDKKPTKALLRMKHEFDPAGWEGRPSEAELDMVRLVKKSPEKIKSPKELDQPIKPISQRMPVFPSVATTATGDALIEIYIGEDGRAYLPKVAKCSDSLFGYAAAQAVREWRFEIPKVAGKPVVVRARVPVTFAPKNSVPNK